MMQGKVSPYTHLIVDEQVFTLQRTEDSQQRTASSEQTH